MEPSTHDEREIRAARNQSMFRALNEKLRQLNESFASATETFKVACECADRSCIAMVDMHPHEYFAVRSQPRHFVVRPGHVFPDVEDVVVVRETERYVVVEKTGTAAEVAEILAAETPGS